MYRPGLESRVPNKYMEPCPKNLSFFSKKKQNALNSLKSTTNLNFTSHLVESQTCAVGGWGPMFGTKSQKNGFFYTFPNHLLLCFCDQNQRAQHLFPSFLLFFISGHSMLYFSWFWFLNSSLIFMM